MAELKEQLWLYRIRALGDHKAFERILWNYQPALLRFLTNKLPKQEDADDAFSLVSLRLWNYLQTARVEHLSGLIFTIARGVIAEFYRKRPQDISLDLTVHENQDVTTDKGKGAGRIVNQAEVTLVREAIKKLSDTDATYITLHYLEHISIKEIAEEMDKKENTVRVGLSRAMEHLREVLEDKPL